MSSSVSTDRRWPEFKVNMDSVYRRSIYQGKLLDKVPICMLADCIFGARIITSYGVICRVRTDPGKPGIYWNLIIRIPGLEYTGISSRVLENTGIGVFVLCDFSTLFIFVMLLNCDVIIIIHLVIIH